MCQKYELKNLVAAERFTEATAYFDDPAQRETLNEWDIYYCMKALQKTGRDADAIELYRLFEEKYPDSQGSLAQERCADACGWALYRTVLKNEENAADADLFRRTADRILEISAPSSVLLRWRTVQLMLTAIQNKLFGDTPDYRLACEYLDRVDPKLLSDAENRIDDGQGITRSTMSDREKWYSFKSKWLLSLGEYDACIATCEEALSVLTDFHNNNGSWFTYRKAKSELGLGHTGEAAAYVQDILDSGFEHWCLHGVLFELAAAEGDRERAKKQAGYALRRQPDYTMCVALLAELADFLAEEDPALACQHRRLEVLLREEKAWPVKESALDAQIPADVAALSVRELLGRLQPVWNRWSDLGKTFLSGTVDRILDTGNSGFIRAENGSSYYFSMRDLRCPRGRVTEGVRVRFTLKKALDRKKNEMKDTAADISLA